MSGGILVRELTHTEFPPGAHVLCIHMSIPKESFRGSFGCIKSSCCSLRLFQKTLQKYPLQQAQYNLASLFASGKVSIATESTTG